MQGLQRPRQFFPNWFRYLFFSQTVNRRISQVKVSKRPFRQKKTFLHCRPRKTSNEGFHGKVSTFINLSIPSNNSKGHTLQASTQGSWALQVRPQEYGAPTQLCYGRRPASRQQITQKVQTTRDRELPTNDTSGGTKTRTWDQDIYQGPTRDRGARSRSRSGRVHTSAGHGGLNMGRQGARDAPRRLTRVIFGVAAEVVYGCSCPCGIHWCFWRGAGGSYMGFVRERLYVLLGFGVFVVGWAVRVSL